MHDTCSKNIFKLKIVMYSCTVFLIYKLFYTKYLCVVNLNYSYTSSESPSLKTTQLFEGKWKFSQDIHYLIQYLCSHFHHLLLKWWHITPSWLCLKKSVCIRIVYSFHLLPPQNFLARHWVLPVDYWEIFCNASDCRWLC